MSTSLHAILVIHSRRRNNVDAKKNAKKRKASEMEGIDSSPSAAKKRAKPTPRVTKGRVKGEPHAINSYDISLIFDRPRRCG